MTWHLLGRWGGGQLGMVLRADLETELRCLILFGISCIVSHHLCRWEPWAVHLGLLYPLDTMGTVSKS